MLTFKELRESLKSGRPMSPQSVHQKMEDLNEESWLNKGFALSQYSRHASMKQQINTVLSGINSICDRGKREQDVVEKLDLLFDAIKESARLARGFAELSSYTLNVSVSSSLLAEDLRKIISSELAKIQQRR